MEDLSEKEQLEMMRSWWAENGRYVIGGVVLGLALLFGWNRWQTSLTDAQLEASAMYEEVMTGVGEGDMEAADAAADTLFATHPDSAYASLARLAMARLYMDNGRDQDAAEVLRAVVEQEGDSELALVARLRLARVLLYQDKPDDVVTLIEGHLDTAFAPLLYEVLGDAQVALGDYAAAEAAYTTALTEAATAGVADTALLQLKLNDLPAAVDDAADESEVADDVTEEGDTAGTSAAPQVSGETTDADAAVDEDSEAVDESATAVPDDAGEEDPE